MGQWMRYGHHQTAEDRARGPSKPKAPTRVRIEREDLRLATIPEGLAIIREEMEDYAHRKAQEKPDASGEGSGQGDVRATGFEGPGGSSREADA